MDPAAVSLQAVLIVLACAVVAVVACRSLRLPAMIGYLVTGLALGPYALHLMSPEREDTRLLAQIGVVFLMFSIGLEFSLSRLLAMRRVVFGLGLAQVASTVAIVMAAAALAGWGWQAGLAAGGALGVVPRAAGAPGPRAVRIDGRDRDGGRRARRLGMAGRARARRHRGDVVDRDRVEDARRAHGARFAARPRDHRRALVPGPRGGAPARDRAGARAAGRRARRGARHRA